MFRIITGVIIVLVGFFLLLGGGFVLGVSSIPSIGIIIVGIAILLNKQEDEIEEIKSDKK